MVNLTISDGGGGDNLVGNYDARAIVDPPAWRVSIVIRALNEAAHLPTLYEMLRRQTLQPHEIILVDSGSSDDTVAISERAGATIIHIRPEDFSFGRALNVGCQAATGDLLTFVSAHVYPLTDTWLEHLVAPFDDSRVALTYGRQTGDDRTKFSESELMRRWFPDVSQHDQESPFCNNANCAVRRALWEMQPYDEDLTGLEDVHWASRIKKAGYKISYVTSASIAHIHEESFRIILRRYEREAMAQRHIFPDQRVGALEAISLAVLNTMRDYVAAIRRRVFLDNLTDIPRFRTAQFVGTWKGFRHRSEPTSAMKRRFYYPKNFEVISRTLKPTSKD